MAPRAVDAMMPLPRWVWIAAGVVVVVMLASLGYQHFANRGVDPAIRDSLTVLAASRRADSLAHARAAAKAETVYVQSQARSDSSRTIAQHAAADHARAAAAAQAARDSKTASDSARYWRAAYEDEQRRGDSLDAALAVERRASESARASALEFHVADSLSTERLARVERLNASMTTELERVSGGCHLLPFVRCPTRKETAIGSAVLTYVVMKRTNIGR